MEKESILSIENLKVYFSQNKDEKRIIDGLSLTINVAEIVALVGGSGSGKTLTALSILRLLPSDASVAGGKIIFEGQDLMRLSESEMWQIRGKKIGMVFQEPLSAFNPLFTIGFQLAETIRVHSDLRGRKVISRAIDLLKLVGLSDAEKIISDYPHQLSAGMRQRAMIAQAIAVNPRLIIADEPTSNLDVTLQAQIMALFRQLKEQVGVAIILITHDLAMVANLADRIAIVSGGRIVECADAGQVFKTPQHEYSRKLVEAVKI